MSVKLHSLTMCFESRFVQQFSFLFFVFVCFYQKKAWSQDYHGLIIHKNRTRDQKEFNLPPLVSGKIFRVQSSAIDLL